MTDPNSELRERISRLLGWSQQVFRKLASLSGSTLSHHKWMKLVAEYYIDMMNSDGSDAAMQPINETLLLRTVKKSSCSYCATRAIFKEARSAPTYKKLVLERNSKLEKKYPLLSAQDLEALALRYYIPLQSGGHFLSIDTELYQSLLKSSKLPVLECYASPYNHNLNEYCSLFSEDRKFGACPRFDVFSDRINFPCRLIANPPYTVKALKTCIDKLLKYMRRQNGEFIALLPIMKDCPKLEELLNSENTASVLLQGGSYLLHDFASGTDIIAPMQLYIVANIEGCYAMSALMVANIATRSRDRAREVIIANAS